MKRTYTLRKQVLLFLLLVMAGMAKAQTHEFAPVGAEWYYERFYREGGFYLTGITYDRFRSLRTVEINGWECKEIELFQNLDCTGTVNPYTEIRYVTQEGDQVYEVEDGQRFLLYDFSKEVGEWWYAPKYQDTIRVLNVSYITLDDGSVRKFLEIQPSNLDWYFYKIIEGVGMDHALFPYFLVDGAPCVAGPLRCYSEDGLPLIVWSETECDYEILAVDEQGEDGLATMNTLVDDLLHIEFSGGTEAKKRIEIFGIRGETFYAVEIMDNALDIRLADKSTGLYLVRITIDSSILNYKIVKR